MREEVWWNLFPAEKCKRNRNSGKLKKGNPQTSAITRKTSAKIRKTSAKIRKRAQSENVLDQDCLPWLGRPNCVFQLNSVFLGVWWRVLKGPSANSWYTWLQTLTGTTESGLLKENAMASSSPIEGKIKRNPTEWIYKKRQGRIYPSTCGVAPKCV